MRIAARHHADLKGYTRRETQPERDSLLEALKLSKNYHKFAGKDNIRLNPESPVHGFALPWRRLTGQPMNACEMPAPRPHPTGERNFRFKHKQLGHQMGSGCVIQQAGGIHGNVSRRGGLVLPNRLLVWWRPSWRTAASHVLTKQTVSLAFQGETSQAGEGGRVRITHGHGE
ncbi:MAG: hypothetical protein ACLFU6_13300, partial [Candidatus Hydrogenedentota bacterium]